MKMQKPNILTAPVFTDRPELAKPFLSGCAKIAQRLKAGTVVTGKTHFDRDGKPIDLSGRKEKRPE